MKTIAKMIETEMKKNIEYSLIFKEDLNSLIKFVCKFIGIEYKNSLEYDSLYRFLNESHNEIYQFRNLLEKITNYIPLAFKIADFYESHEGTFKKERKMSDKAILNMIENFEEIHRSGRNKKINIISCKGSLEDFQKKYSNILEYYEKIKNGELKLIRDFSNILQKMKIPITEFRHYLEDYNLFLKDPVDEYSDRSLYRHKLIKLKDIQKSIFWIEKTIENYKFYMDL
jgi:hypothetical protein